MKIELRQVKSTTTRDFCVEVGDELFYVTITLNSNTGQLVSTLITNENGDLLEQEGSDGELYEEILNTIDAQWDELFEKYRRMIR